MTCMRNWGKMAVDPLFYRQLMYIKRIFLLCICINKGETALLVGSTWLAFTSVKPK